MNRLISENGEWKEVTYIFNSMSDFTNYLSKNKDTHHVLNKSEWLSHETSKYGFHDSRNYNEFLEFLKKGKEEYNIDTNIFVTDKFEPKFEKRKDWYGSPNIPRTIINLPKSSSRLIKSKPIKHFPIYISFSEMKYVESNKIKEYRLKTFEKINHLISEGHSVDLTIFSRSSLSWCKVKFNVIIHLKQHNQNPDMNKIMYFVCSPDIFRRGVFRLREFDKLIFNDQNTHGYGISESSRFEYIEKNFDAILIHSLTSFGGDIDAAIQDVEKRLTEDER